MNGVRELIQQAYSFGAKFILDGDRVRVQASAPLPDGLLAALRSAKSEVQNLLEHERQEDFHCWVLEEWRRVSIPDWRRILAKVTREGDTEREQYARWMLREVLLDPEYAEPEP